MTTTEKSEQLRAAAKKAIDAIVSDGELDDDTKEDLLEELQEHTEDSLRMLGDEEDDEEDDEDEDGEGEDGEGEEEDE